MHPCLCVDEVVRLIAHELVASRGKATSVSLACCCKNLEDPVLDVLWQTQQELLPLLKTLPGDVWNDGQCNSFRRIPTTLEWARFRKYTWRMRKLRVPGNQSSEVFTILQLYAINKPFFPNLKYFRLFFATPEFIPSIPLFLSSRTTSIVINFKLLHLSRAMVVSVIATFPTLCPNLQHISLWSLPRDPMITAAVSGMSLASSWNTLRYLKVDSPLTEEACEVVFKLPNLCELSVDIEWDTSLPLMELPNLTDLTIKYYHGHGWLQGFRGATLGKLTAVAFHSKSESTGDFLEAFESVALTTSIPATLSTFVFETSHQWMPNYRSLLPFTQLKKITVDFSCEGGCSSTINDDIVTDIARAMPQLERLHLGEPCQTPTGITAKGLAALARHCLHLSTLCIHFQVASLDPPVVPEAASSSGLTIPREDCALTELWVGEIELPEESVAMVALTLLRIFPHIEDIQNFSGHLWWDKVGDIIYRSRQLVDYCSRATIGGAA